MSKGWVRGAVVALIGMALSAGTAFADGHRHEYRHWNRHEPRFERAAFGERHHDRDFKRERASEWRRDHQRDRRIWERQRRERRERLWRAERREHRNDHRPAGWDRGRKTGWGDSHVPPGQAKKADWGGDHGHGNDHRGR